MRILVAIESVDLRKGIDGLAQVCREKLNADPFSGCLFIFRTSLFKSKIRRRFWPGAETDENVSCWPVCACPRMTSRRWQCRNGRSGSVPR